MKIGIEDVISPYSLDQFLISNTPRTRKHVKQVKKSNDSRIVVSRQFDFTQKSKGVFSVAKNIEFIEVKRRTIGCNCSSRSTVRITRHFVNRGD